MDYSNSLKNTLTEVLTIQGPNEYKCMPPLRYLGNSDILNKYFEVNLTDDIVEIPLFARRYIENTTYKYRLGHPVDIVSIQLKSNNSTEIKKSFDSAIRSLFTAPFLKGLYRVLVGDYTYYGLPGLIMDNNFNILLLYTIKYRKLQPDIDRSFFKRDSITIYVNPDVFVHNNSIITRGIINKVIPFYMEYNILRLPGNNTMFNNSEVTLPIKINTIIENPSKFIYHTETPTVQKYSDNLANDIITKYSNEVNNCFIYTTE